MDMEEFLIFTFRPIAVLALVTLGILIPHVGPFFQEIRPIISFFVFISIGSGAGENAIYYDGIQKWLFVGFFLVVCSLAFISPIMTDYYALPIQVTRFAKANQQVEVTYQQALGIVKDMLRQETGSDGVLSYAIYTERIQLTDGDFSAYSSSQFEDIDDAEGILSAILNIVIHAVPILLTWVFYDILGWVSDAGLVGLTFWYVFSVTVSIVAFYKAD